MTTRTGYEFVVVGAGAAGCVIAARLSESGSALVALLEAGPDLRGRIAPDLLDGWNLGRPPDWGFRSEPLDDGDGLPLRRCRLIGGTSWLTRFAVRGSPGDFDGWERLGNPGWAFDAVLPFFRRLETDIDFGDRPWHGGDGPIPINRYRDLSPSAALGALTEAAVAAGFPMVDDHNEPGAVGVGPMPMSSRDGTRVTAAAYLPDTPRSNLAVRADAQVASVIFEGTRVTGVRLIDGSIVESERVVLCCGTYGSPAILLRSGVGPADHLDELGIPVVVDLPGVGSNLADHPATDIDVGFVGAARAAPILHVIATFHSQAADPAGAPDLMLWTSDPGGPDDEPQMTLDVVLLKPEARGTVRLRSADPTAAPRIRLPRMDREADRARLAEGLATALEIAHSPSLRRIFTGSATPRADAEALRRAATEGAYSIPHVVGTCAMGPAPESGAVVDAEGRVHGVEGLYVADASIIPEPPSGFPHLATMMIAERLAASIGRS